MRSDWIKVRSHEKKVRDGVSLVRARLGHCDCSLQSVSSVLEDVGRCRVRSSTSLCRRTSHVVHLTRRIRDSAGCGQLERLESRTPYRSDSRKGNRDWPCLDRGLPFYAAAGPVAGGPGLHRGFDLESGPLDAPNLIWRAARWTPRYFLALSCIATVVAFAIQGYFALRQTKHLQEVYPYISMENRLRMPRKQVSTVVLPVATANRLADMETLIEDKERSSPSSNRAISLRQIHEQTVQIFVNQQGFGATRASGLREHLLKQGIRQEQSIPQPGTRSASPWLTELWHEVQADSLLSKYPSSLVSLHRESVVDFVNLPGFGYIRDRQHVAGFQEHQVSQSPTPAQPWTLQTLDLIGLVLHEKPTAYVSENLPRMKELRVAPTRNVDEFESAGLLALECGEDLFIREKEHERRMLGAIRAARQCLACHDVERGELLGAFSYRMTLDGN